MRSRNVFIYDMKLKPFKLIIGSVLMAFLLSSITATAQQNPGRGDRGDRGNRGRGNFDISQFMDRIVDRYKDALEVSEAEWSAIKPMISKIITQQFSGRSSRGGFGGFGGTSGRGGGGSRNGRGGDSGQGGGDRQRSSRGGSQNAEVEALQKALDSGASSSSIKSKLASVRDARKKKEAELKKVRDELRQVLSLKQEARMVLMGLLD